MTWRKYYPFGLMFNSYQRENSIKQKFRFQGQEPVDDLNLAWDSFKWRNHMPEIGRFFNVDPLSEKYVYNSTYAFSENKVVSHVEIEGLEAMEVSLITAASADAAVHPNGVGAHILGVARGLLNFAEGLVNAVSHPIQTAQGLGNLALAGLAGNPINAMQMDAALGTNSYGTMVGVSQAVMNGANNLISGNGIQRGTVIGEIGGAILGSKGLGAGLRLGGNALSVGLRSVTTSDGFLFGSLSIKAPVNIPVQRFGTMSIAEESAFGLRTGSSAFSARTFNAILPKWNNLTNYTIGTIPKGTGIRLGITAPQGFKISWRVPSNKC